MRSELQRDAECADLARGDGKTMTLMSSVMSLEGLFADELFVHASVQRDFQWTDKECDQLIDDLWRAFALTPRGAGLIVRESDKENGEGAAGESSSEAPQEIVDRPYYLGAVVIGQKDDEERRAIFDGLQRLTAITILMAVLRDVLGEGDVAERLHRAIFKPPHTPRMRLPIRDGSLHDEVQVRGATKKALNKPPATDMAERIRTARALFKRKAKNWTKEEAGGFASFILERTLLTIVEVDDAFLAIRIFMSTNTRGKPLLRADVLKGQIVELVAQESGAEAAERAAAQWSSFQKRLGDDLELYIRSVAFMNDRRDRGIDFVGGLFNHLQQAKTASAFVGQLSNAITAWEALMRHREARRPLSKADATLWRMTFIPWHEWKPLALAVLKDYRADAEALLVKVERMTIAIAIADLSRDRRSEIYARALESLYRTRGGANWTPYRITAERRARILSGLFDTALEPRDARPVVSWLEALRAGAAAHTYLAEGSLEHILPLNPDSSWQADFPTAEIHQTNAQQLGNMAWIDKASNDQLAHNPFPVKQSIIRRLKLQQRYALIGDVLKQKSWNPEVVAARTKGMANTVLAYIGQPLA